MKIKSIELMNIRSHKDSVINLSEGVTSISGRTGSGKSSFLLSIEYALFGADVNLNNNMMLRRNAKEGHVKLTITKGGDEYEIMRGMIKKGEVISVNPEKLWIRENGKKIPLIARTNELNEKIIELLNYPKDVKPKELFEVTCYARQDEIRKLIDLSNENRQKFIDRVLQLSKYQLTWTNLKDLMNELEKESSNLKGQVEQLPRIKSELESKSNELRVNEKLVKELVKQEGELVKELSKINVEFMKAKQDYDESLNIAQEIEKAGALAEDSIKREKTLDDDITKLREELKSFNELPVASTESLIEEKSRAEHEIKSIEDNIKRINSELRELKVLGSKCPLCRQAVCDEHKNVLINNYDKEINKNNESLINLKNSLSSVSAELQSARLIQGKLMQKSVIESKLSAKDEELKDLRERLNEVKAKSLKDKPDLTKLKIDYEKLNNLDKELNSELSAVKSRKSVALDIVNKLINEVSAGKSLISELAGRENQLIIKEGHLSFITRVREDIKNIREVVRARFLEDLRAEFQKKYEEVRGEDDYCVDINPDYEPYAVNEEVKTPIGALSGGEKTSVALSYRLGLSEVAARISQVDKPEILILDEPTYGFDRNDIKSLPHSLKNIKTIPQIIIVSHEEELKNAAEHKFVINKRGGVSEAVFIE